MNPIGRRAFERRAITLELQGFEMLDMKGAAAAAALMALIAMPSGASAGPTRTLASAVAEIDRGFTCPEFLADSDARRAEALAFSRILADVGPRRLTYQQASYIRSKILDRHNCSRGTPTAAAMAPGTDPVATAPAIVAISADAAAPQP